MNQHIETRLKEFIKPSQVARHLLKDDGLIPNNDTLPLLVYPAALDLTGLAGNDPAAICEAVLAANRWGGSWRNGIHPFHHYRPRPRALIDCGIK